jgi:hypothetical protein
MKDWIKEKLIAAQWWLTVLATLFTCWAAYEVFISTPKEIVTGEEILPQATCPGGRADDVSLSQSYRVGRFIIFYNSERGCNVVTPGEAVESGEYLEEVLDVYLAYGLARPQANIAVALQVQSPAERVKAYTKSGSAGALAIDVARPPEEKNYSLSVGLAELLLANTAPGLSSQARRRVAGAYAALANIPSNTEIGYPREFNTYESDGLFDAWLTTRFNRKLLLDTLNACRQECSWSQALSVQLRKRGANLTKLERQFSQRATSSSAAAASLAERLGSV